MAFLQRSDLTNEVNEVTLAKKLIPILTNQPINLVNIITQSTQGTKKASCNISLHEAFKKRRLSTLPQNCSTIDVDRLNFSVRNGKRWNPVAITT